MKASINLESLRQRINTADKEATLLPPEVG